MLVALSELARRRLWPGAAHDRRSVTAPALLGAARLLSVRDIALQRAYVRACLDRYVCDRRTSLLDGPSRRWRQASVPYRSDAVREPNRQREHTGMLNISPPLPAAS